MKNLKKIIACVMAIATIGSSMIVPTSVNAFHNDNEVITYFDGSYHLDENYYKSNSVSGRTGIICLTDSVSEIKIFNDYSIIYDSFESPVDGKTNYSIASASAYYYYDDTTSCEMTKVNSLDISNLDNLVLLNASQLDETQIDELLNKLNLDKSSLKTFSTTMPYLYDNTTNGYKYYYANGTNLLLTGAYLPTEVPTNDDDIITYLTQTYQNYTNYYLQQSDILDKPILTCLVKEDDNFTSGDDFLYYVNGNHLATFTSGINCTLFFESDNPNLTIDDVLTKEQQEDLYFLEDENSEDYCVNIELRNSGVSDITGLTRYSMYLPKIKKDLSTNEFFEYKYKIGQSLLDKGIAKNSFFRAVVSYDDYNNIALIDGNIVITMNDGSSPTTELFGQYADNVKSIEKFDCEQGTTIDGEKSYYKVTLNSSENLAQMVLSLKDNPSVKNASCIDYGYSSTEMACPGKTMSYEIPIQPSRNNALPTVGTSDEYYQQFIDAEPTNIRGDVNYDGKVNSADILFLRRYLLHLLKW